jgi:type VI secretion system secreted protein Hcp
MLKKLVSAVVAVTILAASTSALAAQTASLRVKGKVQNDIRGGGTQKGREGTSTVIATSHEVVSPRDVATGAATGRRIHKPYTVIVEADKALPLYYKALASNETLTEVTVQFYHVDPRSAGPEVGFYNVKLGNAHISNIRFVQPNALGADTRPLPEQVEIQFTYEKITWTWTDGAAVTTDDSVLPGT